MITYKKCSEVNENFIFDAFKAGFSDYIIKIEMPKNFFFKRFFGPEGNSLNTSFVALDNDKAIGLVLGGIKNYEGIITQRCGTFAVLPEYRGKGISQQLFKLHKEEGIRHSCKQLFLEVIVGNDRAINFYKKFGYEKIYDLVYFTCHDLTTLLNRKSNSDIIIRQISDDELQNVRAKIKEVHINWQNDLYALAQMDGQVHYGAFLNNLLVGAVSANGNAKVSFIWVDSYYRGKGIGLSLLQNISKTLELAKLTMGFPNNASLEGFIKHIGFTRDNISQYEMYLTL